MLFRSKITGTGSFLPEKRLTNQDLEALVDTSHEWIVKRTGIHERRIASPAQATSDFAYLAAERALEAADLSAQDIDAIFVATVSPDYPLPSTACVLQARLKCRPIMAVDMAAACSGFLYALTTANQFIKTGFYRHILVVGAETLSRMVNYRDRQTCVIFGDGAGACVVSRAGQDSSDIISSHLSATGDEELLLAVRSGGSRHRHANPEMSDDAQYITMSGSEIFRHAVHHMQQRCREAFDANKVSPQDIDTFLFHQANARILEALAHSLDIPMAKIPSNIATTGNTSSASIPILFDEQVRNGVIKRGDRLLMAAFGAGLTSGSVFMRY